MHDHYVIFVDGRQMSNISSPISDTLLSQLAGTSLGSPTSQVAFNSQPAVPPSLGVTFPTHPAAAPAPSNYPIAVSLSASDERLAEVAPVRTGANVGTRFYTSFSFRALPFHPQHGRNVSLSSDRSIAVRSIEEYCNAYVFSPRPFTCGERIVIQVNK